ncbi:hypothetical protein [Acinetobacter sp.]|uniref:hypothetical protein n=1 Tax=Acinetobacter sp. TaxID=472 RepID=UPI003340EE6C
MVQTVQDQLPNRHQLAAQELIQVSASLERIYLDQLYYLKEVNADNFFQFDHVHQKLGIANQLLQIKFDEAAGLSFEFHQDKLAHLSETPCYPKRLIEYVSQEIFFYTRSYDEIHPTDLKTKAQILRQTLIEQIFDWIDGENRVEQYLYNIREADAEQIDRILIRYNYFDRAYVSDFAKYGKAIPLSVEINIKHLLLINSVLGQTFLSIQQFIPKLHHAIFALDQFLPKHFFRIFKVFHPESLRLCEIEQYFTSYRLLSKHAQEFPQMLAYTKHMKRGFWQYQDLLSKQHFLQAEDEYWELDRLVKLPIFTLKRTVNWLYKQNEQVNDWISRHIGDVNVRVTITVLSLIDTSKISPDVILAVLKYFKNSAARLFLIECHSFAITHEWQKHPKNRRYCFGESPSEHKSQQKLISNSYLYIEEWLDFAALILGDQTQSYKKIFAKLSRVVQAFMLFVQQIANQLPPQLLRFIDPQLQQHSDFFIQMRKHNIQVDDFRKKFKHINTDRMPHYSIYDSFVLDYVMHLFNTHHEIERNVTWSGLYQQAKKWHMHNDLVATMSKLKEKITVDSWDRIAPMQKIYFEGWCYEELNSLQGITQESVVFKHCLAVSYSTRIVEREYAAFHMSNITEPNQVMTLGCYYKLGQLSFDQLRLPNNHIPEQYYISKALAFIENVNQHLKWKSSIQPNEELGNL